MIRLLKTSPPLEPGDRVRIRPGRDKQWRQAEVLRRSYVVRDQQGTVFRRNETNHRYPSRPVILKTTSSD